MNLPTANLISGGVQAASGLIGSIINYKSQKNTNDANLRLATMQNDWNVQQWNRENEYNSPSNQVRLLQEAGINPNVYKGDGSQASSLESADMANQQAPQIDLNTPMQSGLQALQQAAQAEELRASIKESYQRQRIADSLLPYQITAMDLANGLTMDQRRLTQWQGDLARQQYGFNIPNQAYMNAYTQAQTRSLEKGIEATDASIKATNQGITESQARIDQAWKDLQIKANLSRWQIEQMKADIAHTNADTNMTMFRYRIAKKYGIDPNLPALNNLILLGLSDPTQFNNIVGTLKTNFSNIYDHGMSTGRYMLDAFKGWRNPFRHGSTW